MTIGRSRRVVADVGLVVAAAAVDLVVWDGDSVLWNGRLLPVWVVPVMTVVIYPSLLLRRRRPLVVLAVFLAYALAVLLLPRYQPFAGLLLAVFSVGRYATPRRAVLVLLAVLATFAVDSAEAGRLAASPVRDGLAVFAVWVAVAGTIWGFSRLLRQVEIRGELLRVADAARAVQDERLRLARELHDVVANAVSAMLLQAAGARAIAPLEPSRTVESLQVIEATGVRAMEELHRLLHLLRTAGVSDAQSSVSHVAELELLVGVAQQAGLDVRSRIGNDLETLDPRTDLIVYRVVQEGLANASKYAGPGARCDVVVERTGRSVTVQVRDCTTGVSWQPDGRLSSGLGLVGLRERVDAVGGAITWAALDDGFLLQAQIPLSAASGTTPAVALHSVR